NVAVLLLLMSRTQKCVRWVRKTRGASALAVLRSLPGLLQAVLLRLLLTRITGEEAFLLQRRTLFPVELGKGARDAEAKSAGLTGRPATGDGGEHVVHVGGLRDA